LHNLPADTSPSADAILARMGDDDAAALQASCIACLSSGQPFEFDYTVLASAHGPERIVRIHLSRMRQDGHRRRGMIATYQDVTDRVRRLRAEAESQAKSELLSRVSHDLRTPLNAILGFGRLLEAGNLTVQQHERARHIIDAGSHLLEMVDEVLDATRLRVTGQSAGLVPISLDALIEELWPVSALLARRYDVGLHRDPGAGGALVLTTSSSRLREALTNLLVNAIKYSGRGGVVRLSVDDRETRVVRIHITDNGPGISAELLPRLFIPFDRLGAESRDREGIGLGLPLTRGLVEAMQGSLTVRSELGVGSTFTVELQRALERQEGPMTGLDKGPSLHHQVLLIDDNAANVGLIRSMIDADPRFGVRHARDVHAGLELAEWHKPALIIFGLSLRGDAELDAVRDLATAPGLAGVPIAVMGGDLAPTLASQLGEFGVEAFLAKPLELDRFMRLLDDVSSSSAGGGSGLMNPVERSRYGPCVDACPDRR
jgi:signal transduction histidine kinase/ActR/RegA family two-component response regulator